MGERVNGRASGPVLTSRFLAVLNHRASVPVINAQEEDDIDETSYKRAGFFPLNDNKDHTRRTSYNAVSSKEHRTSKIEHRKSNMENRKSKVPTSLHTHAQANKIHSYTKTSL